jgi:hypothetical protein
MKKAIFALTLLIVVLLPGMGQAQEQTGNDTLPYMLWLPVVELQGCPYRVGEMWYTPRPSGSYPYPDSHYFGLHSPDVVFSETNLTGRMSVALNANMDNAIHSLTMGRYFTALSAKLEQNELIIGQTYYWQAQIICESGVLGPKSAVQEFIATCQECNSGGRSHLPPFGSR